MVDTNTRGWIPADGTVYVRKLAHSFPNISGFVPGSLVRLYYHVPCCVPTAPNGTWSFFGFEPDISYNGGSTWQSLGTTGINGIGRLAAPSIGSYRNTIVIDPQLTSEFSVQIRIWAAPHPLAAGTGTLQQAMSGQIAYLDRYSGTALLQTGINGQQHNSHIIVEELALVRGF